MVDSTKLSPTQIGGIGMGATAGGGILSAFGSISSGIANQNMFDYQSAIANINAQIDRQNAQYAIDTGNQQNLELGLKQGQQLGQQKTALASSGFDIRSGSAAQVIASQESLNRLDQTILRSNTTKTAYNFETQASTAEQQAQMYTLAGENSFQAGLIGAGSSILGSASSVSREWLQGNQVNLWNTGAPSNGYFSLFGT